MIPSATKSSRHRSPAWLVLFLAMTSAAISPRTAAARTWHVPGDSLTTARWEWWGLGTGQGGENGALLMGDRLVNTPAIYPKTIYTNAGKWTFLVTGLTPSTISEVALRIGRQDLQPRIHSSVGPKASLWDFDYPTISPGQSVALAVSTESDTLIQSIVAMEGDVPQPIGGKPTYVGGKIELIMKPGTFTWTVISDPNDPMHFSRPPDAVPCADSALSSLISLFGVEKINRGHFLMSEADSLSPGGIPIPDALRYRYALTFSTDHSVFAAIELFKLCESVREARAAPTFLPQGR